MPSTTRRLLIGLLLSLPLWTGCSRSLKPDSADSADSTNSADSTDYAQEHRVPPDFRMTLGEGGGFAGRWSGFTIEADGSIVEWSGPVAESNARPAGALTPEQAAAVWRDVVQTDFFSQEIDERGEVTAFLRIYADSVEHRVSWVPGVEQIESAKHPSEALYRRTRKMAAAATSTTHKPVTN